MERNERRVEVELALYSTATPAANISVMKCGQASVDKAGLVKELCCRAMSDPNYFQLGSEGLRHGQISNCIYSFELHTKPFDNT